MNNAPSLEQLSRGAPRSGWPIAILCAIALPFSLTSPAALGCSAIGLLTGIEEIRRGRRLLRSSRPAAELRILGWLQAAFTCALLVYFAQKATVLLIGGSHGQMTELDPETVEFLKNDAPDILELEHSLTLFSTLFVGVIAVGWQAWWSRRYFRLAARLGDTRYIAPVVFQPSSEERRWLEELARRRGVSEEEIVRDALRRYPSEPAVGPTEPPPLPEP